MLEDVSSRVGFFDRTAGLIGRVASRAPFFAFCVLLVVLWIVQGLVKMFAGVGLSSFASNSEALVAFPYIKEASSPNGRQPRAVVRPELAVFGIY